MKKIFLSLGLLAFFAGFVKAQQVDQQEAMKKWQEYMTPGSEHKMLAKSNGTWKQEVTMWMAPDAPPSTSTATCTNRMILGGRYQESKSVGKFEGMPFEGISTTGYDNVRKLYVSSWVDNMGTGIMYLEGAWDEASKSITFKGKCTDPMSGMEMPMREVFTIVDDNHQKIEMYSSMGGQEFKTMEIKMSRQATPKAKK